MRKFLLSAAIAALLTACSPPALARHTYAAASGAGVVACNSVAPDLSKQVSVEAEQAVAAAASDLRGGRITPGTYDLVRAVRVGDATGWQGTRAVALDVAESPAGAVMFNWAGAEPGGALDTWTGDFTDTPQQARLAYTCGRIGGVDAGFAAEPNALSLRLQDGANGALMLSFARRP